jgi:hypothetical protein
VNGPIAQAVGLTLFGNALLQGYSCPDLWLNANVFAVCESITFVSFAGSPKAPIETPFAAAPRAWLSALQSEGATGLRLRHVASSDEQTSERVTAGFVAGGGRWLIETVAATRAAAWEGRWRPKEHSDPNREIWDVVYGRFSGEHASRDVSDSDVSDSQERASLRRDLEATLAAIADFAQQINYPGFAQRFRMASACLVSDMPLSGLYLEDFDRCRALPLAGKQLLATAEIAFVFGGVGSWNDLRFSDERDAIYNAITDTLYALVVEAIVTGTNMSCAR